MGPQGKSTTFCGWDGWRNFLKVVASNLRPQRQFEITRLKEKGRAFQIEVMAYTKAKRLREGTEPRVQGRKRRSWSSHGGPGVPG